MITVTISGTPVTILNDTKAAVDDTVDQRPTAEFTVLDLSGTNHYQPGQPVEIYDDQLTSWYNNGLVFAGYIDNVQETSLYPNPGITSDVQCVSMKVHADKWRWRGAEFVNRYAGDIAAEFIEKILSQDGVTAQYARDHVSSLADFSNATMSNLVATMANGGSIQLAPSGRTVSVAYGGSNGWSGASLHSSAQISNGSITSKQENIIQYQATCNVAGAGNAFLYTKIYAGGYTVESNDSIQYDVWINKSSPQIKAGIDVVFTDGSTLRDSGGTDQQGLPMHPNMDLTGYADNQWYTRYSFFVSSFAGKKIRYISVCLEGDNTGQYTAYFRRVKITNGGLNGTTKLDLMEDTTVSLPTTPQIVGNNAYTDMVCQIVKGYEPEGTIHLTAVDISDVGIYQSSFVTWKTTMPDNCSVTAACCVDGYPIATDGSTSVAYLPVTLDSALPGFIAGQSTIGETVDFYFTLTNNADDPIYTPILQSITWSIYPAYQTKKTDIKYKVKSISDFNVGTLTNLVIGNPNIGTAGYLALNQKRRSYGVNDQKTSDQTVFGSNNPYISIQNQALGIMTAAGDARERLDWVGSWKDFTAEFDVLINQGNSVEWSFCYRTTYWGSANNSFAYAVSVSESLIEIGVGSNSSSGSYTQLGSASLTLSSGNWHRLKVVVSGSTHQAYLDDVLYVSVTDSTYTSAGQVAFRVYNPTSSAITAFFRNFGIAQSLSGTWVSAPIDLSNVGVLQDSVARVQPNGDTTQGSVLMEVSLNNGKTWAPCINNQTVPGLNPGVNTSGLTQVLIRLTVSVTTPVAYIECDGAILWAISAYQANGQRISYPLSLALVGRIGSASLSWVGTQPTNTQIVAETSTDAINWTIVGTGATGGASLPNVNGQPAPIMDSFTTNSVYNYVNTALSGGAGATWSYDAAHSRLLVSGGTNALYLYNGVTFNDAYLIIDSDYADGIGLVMRSSASGCYIMVVNDNQATVRQNTIQLAKFNGSTLSTLTSATISFNRGELHRFVFQAIGTILTCFMDGMQILSFDDSQNTPLTSGSSGLYSAGYTGGHFYLFYLQGFGSLADSSTNLYHSFTLSTTDPTVSPTITDITLSVRNPNIVDGKLIPSTQYSVVNSKNTLADCLDDLAKQSDCVWYIGHDQTFYLVLREGQPAPWIATSKDVLVNNPAPQVSNIQDEYRNAEWVVGAQDIRSFSEPKSGDGNSTSFNVGYPVDSITSIVLNGQTMTFGPKGTTGYDFYYEIGSTTISQDASLTTLEQTDELDITYNGQVPVTVYIRNEREISKRKQRQGDSGVVEARDEVSGLNKVATLAYANGQILQYSRNGRQLKFTTMRPGLKPGQLLTAFLPAHGFWDDTVIITDVKITWITALDQNGNPYVQQFFDVQATEGAVIGDWTRLFTRLGKQ